MSYRVVDSSPFITLDRLIEKLQAIQAANRDQHRTYVLNSDNEFLTHVQVVELELSDGSTVSDIRFVRNV